MVCCGLGLKVLGGRRERGGGWNEVNVAFAARSPYAYITAQQLRAKHRRVKPRLVYLINLIATYVMATGPSLLTYETNYFYVKGLQMFVKTYLK